MIKLPNANFSVESCLIAESGVSEEMSCGVGASNFTIGR